MRKSLSLANFAFLGLGEKREDRSFSAKIGFVALLPAAILVYTRRTSLPL